MAQTPNGRLAGKTAVITGGTTGIGRAAAEAFLAEGARVMITGRSEDKVSAAISELGEHANGIAADSTRLSDLDRLAEEVRATHGTVDVLMVNAGNGMFAPIGDVDEALFDKQFDLNVKGAFFTVQKLLPLIAEGGSIILTGSSVHGKGAPGGSLYFASKAAVRSLARSLAAELGPRGIRVNALSPGITPTAFFQNSNVPDETYDQFEAMAGPGSPLGRAGTAAEQAAAAVFLASDDSRYMTAGDLVIDGGWSGV